MGHFCIMYFSRQSHIDHFCFDFGSVVLEENILKAFHMFIDSPGSHDFDGSSEF